MGFKFLIICWIIASNVLFIFAIYFFIYFTIVVLKVALTDSAVGKIIEDAIKIIFG